MVDVVHFGGARTQWKLEQKIGGHLFTCGLEDDPAHVINRALRVVESAHRRIPYTHLIAFGGRFPILASPPWSAWLDLPLVTLLRGNDFDTAIFNASRRGPLLEALRTSSAVCVVSSDKKRKVEALVPGSRVYWTPNGIERKEWRLLPSDRERALAWRAAHVPPGRRVLGMVGQIKPKKGGIFFLDCLRTSGLLEHFHLLLIGERMQSIESWLNDNGEVLSFSCLPFLDRFELLAFYPACDWIVLPSFYDGTPNVLLEALALGIPVLASRVGGMADMLKEGQNAFLFDAGERASCREALEKVARLSESEYGRMRANARKSVTDAYDRLAEARRFLRIFEDIRP